MEFRVLEITERLQLLRLVDVSNHKRNSPISSRFTFMSNRKIVLHKQKIYTKTRNMINDVEMLKIYATLCGYDPIILRYS